MLKWLVINLRRCKQVLVELLDEQTQLASYYSFLFKLKLIIRVVLLSRIDDCHVMSYIYIVDGRKEEIQLSVSVEIYASLDV